jgi:selenocysteine lyase/cysteine desulfurase
MRIPSRRHFLAGLGMASMAGIGSTFGRSPPREPGTGGVDGANAAGSPNPGAGLVDPADEFLMEPGLVHFNTGTTGASPRAVVDATLDAIRRFELNPPSQAYRAAAGTLLQEAEVARARCAAFIGSTPEQFLLTHGTADGLGQVAQGIEFKAGDRVLTSSLEHDSGVFCWRWLGPKRGVAVDVVQIEPELLDTDEIVRRFEAAIRPETRVISVSHVLAWTGLIMPVAEICAMARRRGVLTVIDGAQALGQVPVDVATIGCDAYAGSGHKWLLGPKGTGFLHVRANPSEPIRPVAWADKRRLNSEAMGICPLPLVVGLDVAVTRLAGPARDMRGLARTIAHNLPLRDRLYRELEQLPGVALVGPPPGSALRTGIVAFKLPASVDAPTLRTKLFDTHRMLVRAVAPGVFNGIRLSAHVYNDEAQATALLDALRDALDASG